MEWILFTIGILLGVTLGVIIMSLVVAGRYSDLDNEVISLRIQRNLLKEELLKQKPKKDIKRNLLKRNIKNKLWIMWDS